MAVPPLPLAFDRQVPSIERLCVELPVIIMTNLLCRNALLALVVGITTPHAMADDASFSAESYIEATRILSQDDMDGRAPGTAGSMKARKYLLQRLKGMGAEPVWNDLTHSFARFEGEGDDATRVADGANLVFEIDGAGSDIIVVTAHYDHLGEIRGETFNGADDNASGVAGLLAIADHFMQHPPANDIVFAIVDAEEGGSAGAEAFVNDFDRLEQVRLNINLDMISRSDVDELYVAGGYHNPQFVPLIDEIAATVPVTLLRGHDDPALGPFNDWTMQSDHRVFHRRDIPFLYFGVEDHPDYHKPTDDFDRIPLDFFAKSLQSIVIAAEAIDENLASISAGAAQPTD